MIDPNNDLDLLGDVHLERKFRTGVPLHRLGHREEMVWNEFEHRVKNPTAQIFCQVGDLFNEFSVSERTVLKAAEIAQEAAMDNTGVCYIYIRGNHDGSRDADKASSFDVFKELMNDFENVLVLTEPMVYDGYGFIPWHPFKSSTELAMELVQSLEKGERLKAVIGHWDVKSFGGDDHNLVPVNVLKHVTDTIYTGHIHLPQKLEIDGVTVNVTGSMQPYAHGEDASGELYVTVSYEEFCTTTADTWKNKNVRVLVKEGDTLPEVDCLSLITKRVEDEEEEHDEVQLESFDMSALFQQSLAEKGVGNTVMNKILTKFKEMKHA